MLFRPTPSVADVHFAIGHTHQVCQDYGIVGTSLDFPQNEAPIYVHNVTVSDGCSSSPSTDVGARVLAHTVQRLWEDRHSGISLKLMVDIAKNTLDDLNLLPESLDATLMVIQESLEGCEVFVQGDGVIAARHRATQKLECWAISYSQNAPDYPSYLADPDRHALYRAKFGGNRIIVNADGTVYGSAPPELIGDPKAVVPAIPSFEKTFCRDEYDLVLVMTDGVESFQKKDGARLVPVPLADVLDQITDFKVYTEGFIRRRMHRFLKKFCLENGWVHSDDVTVGGIYMNAPPSKSC